MMVSKGERELVGVARRVWPFPSDPLGMGVEDGIVWAVVAAPFCGVNGYVLIPAEGHPWSRGIPKRQEEEDYPSYATEDLDVHGGITYGACGGGPWIGFDTAHSGDVWDIEFDPQGSSTQFGSTSWDKHWTLDLVIEEAKCLARELARLKA